MPEIVLHHHPTSTSSEKVRLARELKGPSCRQGAVPSAPPKPGLAALTGRHRRAPAVRVGADRGSHLIPRKIEGSHPEARVLVGANRRGLVIRRSDPRAGTLRVPFPRASHGLAPV